VRRGSCPGEGVGGGARCDCGATALSHVLYAAADGVLANSVSEPFGLVGFEAMAAKGVVYTGGTGEDYAAPARNAVVLENS